MRFGPPLYQANRGSSEYLLLYPQSFPHKAPCKMSQFFIKPLSPDTWQAFASLVEAHNGVWGGCWCVEFHLDGKLRGPHRRALKERKVNEGETHAALVFDGSRCVGWCQFGPTEELPRIKHIKIYHAAAGTPPDWRITCFFVDKEYRGQGVASLALAGALDNIAIHGGGTVESYPEDAESRHVSASLLHNGELAMFERQGFKRVRKIGKNHWVVSKEVDSASG
jgi:GNAT superfamily N-acetyltransferase